MSSREVKKDGLVLFRIFLVVLLFLGVVPFHVTAADPTEISLSPLSKTVSAGQIFTMAIWCTPGQLMKSYELRILFNPTYLSANSVTQGTIFTGHQTFVYNGTINNAAGTIDDVYGLIVGSGAVSSPGSLVVVSFTAKLTSGSSTLRLANVGVTNETAYMPVEVTNGTVVLREFSLGTSVSGSGAITKNPNQATYAYGMVVQVTAFPTTGFALSSWGGDLSGSTNPTSITMNGNRSVTATFTQNQYTLTITVDGSGSVTKNPNQTTYTYGQVVTITATPGSGYIFSSWTGHVTGSENPTTVTMNSNKVVTAHFQDDAPPHISGVIRTTSDPFDTDAAYGWVNVSCTVTDNVAVSQVLLRIHTPSGLWNNVSMAAGTAGKYSYRSSVAFSQQGNYSYTIRAVDTKSNVLISTLVLFSMPANWDINTDGRCDILDLVLVSNQYNENGAKGWMREDADNSGVIQVLDLLDVSNHFAESWWTS